MRLLILGGTVFLGRHVVDAALERGHDVTIFTRGKHGTGPDGVEHIAGDRADVTPLAGRTWDAAIDTSGYDPAQVDASSALDVGHYVFVSSCNAYPDWPDKPVDEDSPTWEDGEGYGPDKAAAERHALVRREVARARLDDLHAERLVAEQASLVGQADVGAVGELARLAEIVHERRGQ